MKLHPDNQRVVDFGTALFGKRWHTEFANMTGLSRPYISLIAKGKRPVSEEVKKAITAGIRKKANELRRRADMLTILSAEYLK
jgi:transcriptional regulator with XRE-family HTH domain